MAYPVAGQTGPPRPVSPHAIQGPRPAADAPLAVEPARCPLCPGAEEVPLAVGEDFEYRSSPDTFLAVRCRSCGLVYLRQRPTAAELDRIYPPSYHAFDFSAENYGLAWRVRRRLEAGRMLRFCRGLPRGARILDVGCGDGFHLKLLRQYGDPSWQLEGVDPSYLAATAARRAGFLVHEGSVESLALDRDRYDLALLIATIEHVPDPVGVLRAIRARLRPGGRVAIVTDNTAAWSHRLFAGRYWGGYHFPRHFHLFDPPTIRRLAELTELDVTSLRTMVSPVNWVYSIRNALVDFDVGGWLVNRFSLASPVSLAAFTLVGMLQQALARGELLGAELRRPEVSRVG
jgi:SAM-dependent methyltransferase